MILYDLTVKEIFNKLKDGSIISDIEKRIAFPCLFTKLVLVEKVEYNEYNPNNVPPKEMRLLRHSMEEDGITQPVVVMYDELRDIYMVIDGAHRYKNIKEIFKLPFMPVSIINRGMKDRMASTIRHNRARGEHNVTQMSSIVAELIILGWGDNEVSKHLGMEPDEVLRLKQNTGIAEIFKNHEYSMAWE